MILPLYDSAVLEEKGNRSSLYQRCGLWPSESFTGQAEDLSILSIPTPPLVSKAKGDCVENGLEWDTNRKRETRQGGLAAI